MRFEVLPGLPPYGPMAISFTIHGAREHREGLVVRFYPRQCEPWVGNFLGGMTACTVVLDHPNENDVIVVAKGEASVVDPQSRTIRECIAHNVEEVISLPSLSSVLFRCCIDFAAVKADNSGWRSPRISWDGLRNIEVHGAELLGEAYTPIANVWAPFKLDLLTGHCADGIYEKEMARAVQIVPRVD
jgi:hypothetical protein